MIIEFDSYFTPDGREYTFHNGVDRFLLSFTGMGMPPIDYITQGQIHGEKVIGYRLGPRTIQYIHRRKGCNRQAYWDNRSSLIDFLRPNRQTGAFSFGEGRLRKILPDGSIREINVVSSDGPAFQSRNLGVWEEGTFQESLRFTAHDPTFYDPEEKTVVFALTTLAQHLTFYELPDYENNVVFAGTIPFLLTPNETPTSIFSGTVVNDAQEIDYGGTWLAYPTIVLVGPMDNLSVYQETTGEKLILNGKINLGETVTFSLEPGNKTVTNNFGQNRIGSLSSDSDLSSFHLAPAPEAPDGVNRLRVTFTNAEPNASSVTVKYNTRYIGI